MDLCALRQHILNELLLGRGQAFYVLDDLDKFLPLECGGILHGSTLIVECNVIMIQGPPFVNEKGEALLWSGSPGAATAARSASRLSRP